VPPGRAAWFRIRRRPHSSAWYGRNGLRTSGRWAGSGESLMYVALPTGRVVSTIQESTEEMDVTVTGGPGSSVRYAGAVRTRSQVFLLSEEFLSAP